MRLKSIPVDDETIGRAMGLEAELEMDGAEAAFDVARDIVNNLVDMASVLTAAPARLLKGPTIVADDPLDPRKHTRVSPAKIGLVYSPVPLQATKLFERAIRPELRRVMAWYRRGISEEADVVASLASLFTALDLLGNEFECSTRPTRKCPACKRVFTLEPGATEKNRNVLTAVAGLSADDTRDVLKARQRVVHGGINLTSEDMRNLAGVRSHVCVALTRGLKRALGLGKDAPPSEEYLDGPLGDPFLVVNYTEPSGGVG